MYDIRTCAHGHAWYGRLPACRCPHAGACASCSHFNALQRRRARQSRARLQYFEGSRVCRHVILSKELPPLPSTCRDPT